MMSTTKKPSAKPTGKPVKVPTNKPIKSPSYPPSPFPTPSPTASPTLAPTFWPSGQPSSRPTSLPTIMYHQTEHKSAATGNEIAGGIIGVLAALAVGVGFFIYYKQMMKNSKPLSKMNVDLGDEDDTL